MNYHVRPSTDDTYRNTYYIASISEPLLLLSKIGLHYKSAWLYDKRGFLSTIYRFKTPREAIQCFYKFASLIDVVSYNDRMYRKKRRK